MSWMNNEDNRLFATKISFVLITLGLLVYLHMINANGEYKELIVGIIGIFIGVASIAAKDLISGQSQSEIKKLTERLNLLEIRLAEERIEKEIYKSIVAEIHEKLVDQTGILNLKK